MADTPFGGRVCGSGVHGLQDAYRSLWEPGPSAIAGVGDRNLPIRLRARLEYTFSVDRADHHDGFHVVDLDGAET